MRQLIIGLAALAIAAPAMSTPVVTVIPGYISAAVADPSRPPAQTARDVDRESARVLAFAGVKPGDKVADFMSGSGYFTRIFSKVVGPSGHVYAFLPDEQLANCSPDEVAGTKALLTDHAYHNATVLSGAANRFHLPEQVDLVFTAQNYHDLHDVFMAPTNAAIFNKAVFAALKPGGVFLVVDHAAQPGSELRDTNTLHRIDPGVIVREVEAAGFRLEAQSNVLRNPADSHLLRVFDPVIRGHTDQVVLRFRKPSSPDRRRGFKRR